MYCFLILCTIIHTVQQIQCEFQGRAIRFAFAENDMENRDNPVVYRASSARGNGWNTVDSHGLLEHVLPKISRALSCNRVVKRELNTSRRL